MPALAETGTDTAGPLAPCTVDEARSRLLALVPATAPERRMLSEAHGLIAAEDVRAPGDQPRFDAAAMDGWAVAGSAAAAYRVIGESRAGAAFMEALSLGEAVAISTGAPLPAGATRVVRHEDAHAVDGVVLVPASDGRTDVRSRGSDFRTGDLLVRRGRRIDHLDLARLAAAGFATVRVGRLPRVAIVPTGDELTRPGAELRPGRVHDALSVPLAVRLRAIGAAVAIFDVAEDDPEAIGRRVGAAQETDLLVLIGGASKGPHDHVRSALTAFGPDLAVSSVKVRPGKPFWAGSLADGRMIAGLPGNPVAALACAELFLSPVVRAWQGDEDPLAAIRVPCPAAVPGGDHEHARFAALRVGVAGNLAVELLGGADSAALAPLAGAELLVRLPSGAVAGDPVEAIRL